MSFTGKRKLEAETYTPDHLDLHRVVQYLSLKYPLLQYLGDHDKEAKSTIHVYGDSLFNEVQWFRACAKYQNPPEDQAYQQDRAVCRVLTQLELAILYETREVGTMGGLEYHSGHSITAGNHPTLFTLIDEAIDILTKSKAKFDTIAISPKGRQQLARENCTTGMPYYQTRNKTLWIVATDSVNEDDAFLFHRNSIKIVPLAGQSFHAVPINSHLSEICGAYTLEVHHRDDLMMLTGISSLLPS
jgi:hypothetical protein